MKKKQGFVELLRIAIGTENPIKKEACYQKMFYQEYRRVLEDDEIENVENRALKKAWCEIMDTSTDPKELIETAAKLESEPLMEELAAKIAELNKGEEEGGPP